MKQEGNEKVVFFKKIYRIGSSFAIVVPRDIAEALDLEKGVMVKVVLEKVEK